MGMEKAGEKRRRSRRREGGVKRNDKQKNIYI